MMGNPALAHQISIWVATQHRRESNITTENFIPMDEYLSVQRQRVRDSFAKEKEHSDDENVELDEQLEDGLVLGMPVSVECNRVDTVYDLGDGVMRKVSGGTPVKKFPAARVKVWNDALKCQVLRYSYNHSYIVY